MPEGSGINGFTMFLRTIPYNYYALLTIVMSLFLIFTGTDFGSMKLNEDNAKNGDLFTTEDRPYGDDVDVARKAVLAMLAADSRILKDPEPVVWVAALADSSVNLSIRAWVKNADYWNVFFEHNEQFYKELPKAGINFPFPQMDVHLTKE